MDAENRDITPAPRPPGPLPFQEQQALVLQYTPLVHRIARSLPLEIPGVLEYEDAVGFGTCGLVEAVRRYDPSKGSNFHAYAVRRIRGSIIDAFRRMDRMSRTMRQKARDIQAAQTELQETLGRTPRQQEVAAHLGMTLRDFRDISSTTQLATFSLDRMLHADDDDGDGGGNEPADSGDDADFAGNMEARELSANLAAAVTGLPERERVVIALYYADELTMREIADVLGVSETRVSQLHAQALRRLRRSMQAAEAA